MQHGLGLSNNAPDLALCQPVLLRVRGCGEFPPDALLGTQILEGIGDILPTVISS